MTRALAAGSVVALALLLGACAGKPTKPSAPEAESAETPRSSGPRLARPDQPGEYTAGGLYKPGVADSAPTQVPDISALREPTPKDEPRARYGNRSPYTVLGRSYHVMDSARGYVERGTASWYGEKFHGRATSSLEPYDMYAFSAAHKTLPLPTYARVTNLENGRSVVVRVNDRGPFHGTRLIDLSYAAAIKLGMHVKGTAAVEVRALGTGEGAPTRLTQTPPRRDTSPRIPSGGARRVAASAPRSEAVEAGRASGRALPPASGTTLVEPTVRGAGEVLRQTWLQVASFGDKTNAERLVARLQQADLADVSVQPAQVRGDRVWRVRIGPLGEHELALRLADRIRTLGLGQPTVVAE